MDARSSLPYRIPLSPQVVVRTDIPPQLLIHANHFLDLLYRRRTYIQREISAAVMVVVAPGVPVVQLGPFPRLLPFLRQRYR